MFLRNYYNVLAAGFFTTYSGIGTGQGNNSLQIRVKSGVYSNPSSSLVTSAGGVVLFRTLLGSASYFSVGSGTTAPTYDDYKLENELPTSSYSFVSSSDNLSYDADNKRWVMTITNTVINTSGAAFTVSEIGLAFGSTTTSPLFYRAVLDTPITVTPGNAVNITIPLEYQMPLDM